MLENVTLAAAEPRVVEAICVYVFPAANVVTPLLYAVQGSGCVS